MRPPQPSSLHVLDAHPQAPRGRHRGAGAGVEALTWGVAGDGEQEALGRGGPSGIGVRVAPGTPEPEGGVL